MKDTKALLEKTRQRREWCVEDLARHDEDIARFEKELAEAEKPKLRHGDYGTATYKDKKITWQCDASAGQNSLCIETHTDMPEHVRWFRLTDLKNVCVCGNVPGDLKAIAEPLESLYYDSITCEMRQKELVLKIAETTHYVMANDVAGFILNLRRLLHTAGQA